VLIESDKVQERRKEYIEDLYDKNNKPQKEDMHLSRHIFLPVAFRQPCTKHPADDVTLSNSPPVIYPDPQGGYNPQFSCDTPNHLKFKGGHQGGVYGGRGVYVIVMEGVINNNKILTM